MTLVLVAALAVLTCTLAPLRSAAVQAIERPAAGPVLALPRETSGPAVSTTSDQPLNIDPASAYAAGRGLTALAVLDRHTGTYVDNGANAHTSIGSASVIKVLIAEELLYRASLGELALGPSVIARIETMLIDSNDAAASSLYAEFGGVSLIEAALNRHEMTESGPPADPRYWGNTMISAHDMATFYSDVLDGSLSAADRDFLFGLLHRIAPVAADGFGQLFGVAGLDPRPDAAVKQGWMCCLDGPRNVHSTAVLGLNDRYIIVILTQYSPGLPYEYGQTTATEVARLVLDELTL